MKMNIWLASALIATSSIVTVAHADNGTRVAATSALGSVVGTAIGKSIGGTSGATIGAALGVLVVQQQQVTVVIVPKLQLVVL